MSAFGGKADMTPTCADVRFCPKADVAELHFLYASWTRYDALSRTLGEANATAGIYRGTRQRSSMAALRTCAAAGGASDRPVVRRISRGSGCCCSSDKTRIAGCGLCRGKKRCDRIPLGERSI